MLSGIRNELLDELGGEYSRKLKHYEEAMTRPPYSFGYMRDGSYILPTLRRAYASVKSKLPTGADPFDAHGPVGSFGRKNGLVSRNAQQRYSYPGLREAQKNQKVLGFIYWGMRIFLRAFGPNRFYDLSKLMVYMSIYRKEHRYWKI